MRAAQFRICSKILNWVDVPDYIYAFEKDKSIPKMALKHVNKAVVISVDIKEFFHTIKQNQVMLLFQNLGIGAMPARTLSELCTFKAFVPQGALTSPKLSNIISARSFGPQIKAYCDGKGLILTIYADDITVSSDDPNLNVGEVISAITNIVTQNGFRVNTRKTKVMRRHHRQYVCGVVVNEKTNLIRRERLRLRAIVHNVTVNGPEHEASRSNTTVDHFINELRGKINWYTQLNKSKAEKLSAELSVALKLHKLDIQEVRVSPEGVVSSVEHDDEDDALPWEEATPIQSVEAPQAAAN
jgi:RNA-directed DNA polymerase